MACQRTIFSLGDADYNPGSRRESFQAFAKESTEACRPLFAMEWIAGLGSPEGSANHTKNFAALTLAVTFVA
jgi:hypothetical protein